MENASKALLIAGEVLIGLIVLTILASVFDKGIQFAESFREKSDKQKIIAFNTEFTKYITTNTSTERTYIYAEDVISIINRAINWNETNADDTETVTVIIFDEAGIIEYEIQDTIDFDADDRVQFLTNYRLTDDPTSLEYKFSCEVTLRTGTGRIETVIIRNQGQNPG